MQPYGSLPGGSGGKSERSLGASAASAVTFPDANMFRVVSLLMARSLCIEPLNLVPDVALVADAMSMLT
jgi:hypothetical protein